MVRLSATDGLIRCDASGIQGAIFGMANPTSDIPRVLQMYRDGSIKLDELISRRYTLDEVAQGYEDMHAGANIRGIVTFA